MAASAEESHPDGGGNARLEIAVFVTLTFLLSSIFYFKIISAGDLEAAGALPILGLMWCPGIAALMTRFAFRRNLRGLGWGLGKPRYLLASYGLPLLYAVVAYGLVWLLSGLGVLGGVLVLLIFGLTIWQVRSARLTVDRTQTGRVWFDNVDLSRLIGADSKPK